MSFVSTKLTHIDTCTYFYSNGLCVPPVYFLGVTLNIILKLTVISEKVPHHGHGGADRMSEIILKDFDPVRP